MAALALCPQHMIVHCALELAVVAQDAHLLVFELIWHGSCFDFRVKLSVVDPHIAERLEAEGALVLVLTQVAEALLVQRVPASRQSDAFLL